MSEKHLHEYRVIEGIILEERREQELSVYGSITDGFGGNIGSTTTKTQEFWLKQKDGREIHVDLGTALLPSRPGHEVIMVFMNNVDLPCYFHIRNINETFTLWDPLTQTKSKVRGGFLTLFIMLVCALFFVIGCSSLFLTFIGIKSRINYPIYLEPPSFIYTLIAMLVGLLFLFMSERMANLYKHYYKKFVDAQNDFDEEKANIVKESNDILKKHINANN